jgi:hypothetical protein
VIGAPLAGETHPAVAGKTQGTNQPLIPASTFAANSG